MKNEKLTLKAIRESYRRRYRRELKDLQTIIAGELEGIDDEVFEPSSGLEGTALNVVRWSNRLKALLEVDE